MSMSVSPSMSHTRLGAYMVRVPQLMAAGRETMPPKIRANEGASEGTRLLEGARRGEIPWRRGGYSLFRSFAVSLFSSKEFDKAWMTLQEYAPISLKEAVR